MACMCRWLFLDSFYKILGKIKQKIEENAQTVTE